MLRSVIILSMLFFIAPAVLAYGPCDDDEEKLCSHEFHSETVKTCLHEKVEQLTSDCKAFIRSREVEWKKRTDSLDKAKKACQDDLQKFCPKTKSTRKPFMVCIMTHSEKLAAPCKTGMNRHIKAWLPNIKPLAE